MYLERLACIYQKYIYYSNFYLDYVAHCEIILISKLGYVRLGFVLIIGICPLTHIHTFLSTLHVLQRCSKSQTPVWHKETLGCGIHTYVPTHASTQTFGKIHIPTEI